MLGRLGQRQSLGQLGRGKCLDLDVAAAGNTEVVRAKMRTIESLRLDDTIEGILITWPTRANLAHPRQPGQSAATWPIRRRSS
jgi:hypothetical protein